MSLSIEEREREGIIILDLRGRLTAEEAGELRQRAEDLVERGAVNCVLNLAGVDYIDSTGLGALVIAFTRLRKAGGALKLVNLTRRHLELVVLTKLETVFQVFDDEQSAVNSFFPNREIRRFDILQFIQQQRESEE